MDPLPGNSKRNNSENVNVANSESRKLFFLIWGEKSYEINPDLFLAFSFSTTENSIMSSPSLKSVKVPPKELLISFMEQLKKGKKP